MNRRAPGRSPSARRRRSPSNCGPTACRPVQGRYRRSCRTSGASGTSARTSCGQEPTRSLSQPASVEKMVNASAGYDLPAFEKLTVQGLGRGRAAQGHALSLPQPAQSPDPSVAAAPAPKIVVQIYSQGIQTKMVLRFMWARRWRRRSPGPKARSKASYIDCARGAAPVGDRMAAPPRAAAGAFAG